MKKTIWRPLVFGTVTVLLAGTTVLRMLAGIVIAIYAFNIPFNISIQFHLNNLTGILPVVLSTYRTSIPQMIFDTVFTSRVFLALPITYNRPM